MRVLSTCSQETTVPGWGAGALWRKEEEGGGKKAAESVGNQIPSISKDNSVLPGM